MINRTACLPHKVKSDDAHVQASMRGKVWRIFRGEPLLRQKVSFNTFSHTQKKKQTKNRCKDDRYPAWCIESQSELCPANSENLIGAKAEHSNGFQKWPDVERLRLSSFKASCALLFLSKARAAEFSAYNERERHTSLIKNKNKNRNLFNKHIRLLYKTPELTSDLSSDILNKPVILKKTLFQTR